MRKLCFIEHVKVINCGPFSFISDKFQLLCVMFSTFMCYVQSHNLIFFFLRFHSVGIRYQVET